MRPLVRDARADVAAHDPGHGSEHASTQRGQSPALAPVTRRIVLGLVLVVSAALQFYQLGEWQFFSDDQALQLNVMHGLLVDHHPPVFGMALSVGQAHMGPLFYYILALPLWLGHLDPTAGVAVIGLFQVATVYLIYRLCCLVDAPWAGLCAAALYATSALVVYWSRFLWPNIAPFFIVLALYALVGLARRRSGYLVMLAGSLAVAAQMQPTAVLFIPVAVIWLAAWRPRVTLREVALALGLVVLLFAPVIIHELTHQFAETRAWLSYATPVRPGAGHTGGLRRGLATMEDLGWRVIGFRTRAWVDALLAAAALGVVVCALGFAGRPRAILGRLLLLWAAVYLLAFSLYHGTLHPHYSEPLYPLPVLAIGLLFDLVATAPRRLTAHLASPHRGRRRISQAYAAVQLPASILNASRPALHLGTAIVVIGLAGANIHHLWANRFGIDPSQLDSLAQTQGSEIMLGEMRQAADLIASAAAGQPYNLLVAVRDGAGAGFQYLQRQTVSPPAPDAQPLQFLVVEPADRPAWLWPPATRGRWSYLPGSFVRLPHLLIWRLRRGPPTAKDRGPWRYGADTAGPVTALAATSSSRVLAGFIGGVAESGDGGAHWHTAPWPRRPPDGLAVVSSFASSPACPRRLYAGTFDGVITRPNRDPAWWRPASQPASTEVLSLLADPRRCGVLLAGTRSGVARTADGGRSWQAIAFGAGSHLAVHALVAGADGHAIYAGTTDGVWISTDGGASWPRRMQRREPRPALCLLVHPGGSNLILAGTGAGVVQSSDGGMTWWPTGFGLPGTVYTLLSVAGRGDLLAGTDSGLYRSTDDGATWTRAALPPDVTASALAKAGASGAPIYAATNHGLLRSTDGGVTWMRP